MPPRHWPMIALLPVIVAGGIGFATGPAAAGSLDGQHACRQYIPSAGVTIAVDCAQPVAAVIKASATVQASTCRRFVPSAQMSIEEPCPEPVAGASTPAATLGSPSDAVKASAGDTTKPVAKKVAAVADKPTPAATREPAAAGECTGIIERAQLGSETQHDLTTLRTGCAPGG